MGAECDSDPVSNQKADFGLLFGTYEFIERFLGVRWYTPGEFGEAFAPLKKVETSGLPVDQKPAYFARSYWPFKWNEFSEKESLVFNRRMRAFGTRSGSANHTMEDFYFPYHETRPDFFALRLDGKREFGAVRPASHVAIYDDDRYAVNTADQPNRVVPRTEAIPATEDGKIVASLKPLSWNLIRLSC